MVGLSEDAEAAYYNVEDPRSIQISYENLDYYWKEIYNGDKGVSFDIRIYNYGGDNKDDDDPIRYVNVRIAPTVHDEDGKTVPSPVARWERSAANEDAMLYDGWSNYFNDFEFNVKPNAKPMRYNFTVITSYQTETGEDLTYTGWIHWTLRPSVIPNDFGYFYPGVLNQGHSLRLDVRRYISEIEFSLDAPNEDFNYFGGTSRTTVRREDRSSSDWYPTFIISVDKWASAGTFEGSYTVQYMNDDDVLCEERGKLEYRVKDLVIVEFRSTPHSLVQGTTDMSFTLYVKNTGNTPLVDVEVAISSVSDEYMWFAADHYEGDTPVSQRWVRVGDIDRWGEESVTINVSVDKMMPQGSHRIMFDFRGYYYDYWQKAPIQTGGDWRSTSDGMVPRVHMGSSTITLYPMDYEVTGMDMTLKVVDNEMDVVVSSLVTTTVGTSRENIPVAFYIENVGVVDYRDVEVKMETDSPMSPFTNKASMDGFSEVFSLPSTLRSGDTRKVTIYADLADDAEPGIYEVPVQVTGMETIGGDAISADLKVKLQVVGDGPLLKIRSVTPTTVSAAQDFTLTLDVENIGDQEARNVVLGMYAGADGEGDPTAPAPLSLPLFLGDIPQGNITSVEIPMRSTPGMKDGNVYSMSFTLDYVDAFGSHPSTLESVRTVSIKVAKGAGPMLEIRTVTPEKVEAGKDFTLSLTIFNVGEGTAYNVVLGPLPDADAESSPTEFSPPEPVALPIVLGDIEPDGFAVADIQMRSNPDMAKGYVYSLFLNLDHTDAEGNHPTEAESVQKISFKTEGTGTTTQTSYFEARNTLLSVVTISIIVLVVLVALFIVARLYMEREPREPKPKKEKEPKVETPALEPTQEEDLYATPETQETGYDPSQYQQQGEYDPSQYQQQGEYDPSQYQQQGEYDPSQYQQQGEHDPSQYQHQDEYDQSGGGGGGSTGSSYDSQMWGGEGETEQKPPEE